MYETYNNNIPDEEVLVKPFELQDRYPLTSTIQHHIQTSRNSIRNILWGYDSRLLVVVGPCSIHDPVAAMEYAEHLKKACDQLSDELFIVMRVYFEKPRTTFGWKGFIRDPFLDGSFKMNEGLSIARKLLIDLNKQNLPTGTEFLDTIIPHYLSDLTSWSVIGARTSESQTHRELASALPMPVGFKNSTDGNIKIAVDACCTARHSHHFLSATRYGDIRMVKTRGNADCHIILRGATSHSNYTSEHVALAKRYIKDAGLSPSLLIDCSHGNSKKHFHLQRDVIDNVIVQLENHETFIRGVMIESHLQGGKQVLEKDKKLVYGKSITDECLSWRETLPLLEKLANTVYKLKKKN